MNMWYMVLHTYVISISDLFQSHVIVMPNKAWWFKQESWYDLVLIVPPKEQISFTLKVSNESI